MIGESVKTAFPRSIFQENPGSSTHFFSGADGLFAYPRVDSFEISLQYCHPSERHISAVTNVYSKLDTGDLLA